MRPVAPTDGADSCLRRGRVTAIGCRSFRAGAGGGAAHGRTQGYRCRRSMQRSTHTCSCPCIASAVRLGRAKRRTPRPARRARWPSACDGWRDAYGEWHAFRCRRLFRPDDEPRRERLVTVTRAGQHGPCHSFAPICCCRHFRQRADRAGQFAAAHASRCRARRRAGWTECFDDDFVGHPAAWSRWIDARSPPL